MTSQEWKKLIAKEFNVSNTVAKEMLHAMYEVKKYLKISKNLYRKEVKEEE